MPFNLVTAATSLQIVQADGSIQTLTLPGNIAIKSGTRMRAAVLERNVVGVNAFTQPIWMDPDGTVYPLNIPRPYKAPTLATGAAGSLSGTYRVKMSFCIKDPMGALLAEGPLSVASASVTVASQLIAMTAILKSNEPKVNCRRFYRTATNGTQYFHWFDIEDNTTVTHSEEGADETLSLTPAPDDLTSAPTRLTNITEWKGRLWGVSASDIDTLYATSTRKVYAWPLSFPIRPTGGDKFGITGFLPRRDELGVCKRGVMWKVIGDSDATFAVKKVIEGKGSIAPDSCKVIRDVGYFLGPDGVYAWSNEGVVSITDDLVHPWFNTDTYFNRSQFFNAVGDYDPQRHAYILFLPAAGETTLGRWISYDIAAKRWLGPHKTAALTPTCAGNSTDSSDVLRTFVGSTDGYLHTFVEGNYTDGTASAIDFDVIGKFHAGDPPAPDIEHYWGQLSVLSKILAGGTLTITPRLGGLDASEGTALSHSLITGRERLDRVGTGRMVQLRFRENTAAQGVEIYGYELPWHELGKR